MKKYLTVVLFSVLFLTGYLQAQDVWQPYVRFRTDGGVPCTLNPTEAYFLDPSYEGQDAGDHRFADGTNMFEYHFYLTQFWSLNDSLKTANGDGLHLRFDVQNEFVVEVSSSPISSMTGSGAGTVVAQYTPGTLPIPSSGVGITDGSNHQWIDIPLQSYIDNSQTDLYVAFFDGKPDDGWGPSVFQMGLYFRGPENAGTPIKCELDNDGTIDINSPTSSWPSTTQWVNIKSGATGITSVGDVTGLSASGGIAFDMDDIYFATDVTDANVSNSDSVVFYFGSYDLTDSLNNQGHTALQSYVDLSTVTGYRMKGEPDYKFVVTNIDGTPTLTEELEDTSFAPTGGSQVAVTKTSGGYTVELQVADADLYVPGQVNGQFKVDANTFYPFSFKVIDGVQKGTLITGGTAVDVSPSSWGLKANIFDKTGIVSTVPVGIIRSYTPGVNDSSFVVWQPSGYSGSGHDSQHRWADYTDTLVYHFNLSQIQGWAPGLQVYAAFDVGNEYYIQTSSSLTGPKSLAATWSTKMQQVHDESNLNWVELPPLASSGDLYVWFTDGDTADGGWGSSVRGIRFYYKGKNADSNLVSFIPGSGDQAYLVANHSSGADSQHRWADYTSSFGYRFDLNSLQTGLPARSTLFFGVHVGNEWRIEVSADTNTTKYFLADWTGKNDPTQQIHDESNSAWQLFSLQPYIDSGWAHVVFYFSDEDTADGGWGASVRADFSTGTEQPGVRVFYRQILGYYTFDSFVPSTPVSPSEARYLVQNPTGYIGSGVDATHRWADGTTIAAYRFNKDSVMALDGGKPDVALQVTVAQEYVVWVNSTLDTTGLREIDAGGSADQSNPNLTRLFQYNANRVITQRDESNRTTLEIDLNHYWSQGWDTVYVFFTDGRPQDGWGPSLRLFTLSTLQQAVLGIKKAGNNVPSQFTLDQNYPNPFNPSTTIRYAIPASGKVVLKIYNILGQEVKTLVDHVQAPGSHQIVWNGDNNAGQLVASGVYFYRVMYRGNSQLVKKMLLLK